MAIQYDIDPLDDIAKMAGDFEILQSKAKDAIAPAVEAGAKLVETAQKRFAPVGSGPSKDPHGRLRNFISTFMHEAKGSAYASVGLDLNNHPEIRGEAVANEFGRKDHYIDELKKDANGKNLHDRRGRTIITGKKIHIGAMEAHSYIRAGFDSVVEAASKRSAEVFLDEVGFKK